MPRNGSIACLMSDLEFGHPDFGWIARVDGEDGDDEDMRYERFLKKQGFNMCVVGAVMYPKETQ